jgi:hypothetical protein
MHTRYLTTLMLLIATQTTILVASEPIIADLDDYLKCFRERGIDGLETALKSQRERHHATVQCTATTAPTRTISPMRRPISTPLPVDESKAPRTPETPSTTPLTSPLITASKEDYARCTRLVIHGWLKSHRFIRLR